MNESSDREIESLAKEIVATYEGDSGINFIDVTNLPVREKILKILDLLMEVLFPGYTGKRVVARDGVGLQVKEILREVRVELVRQVELALRHKCRMQQCTGCDCQRMARETTEALLKKLAGIRTMLKGDVHAAYDGDPAAESYEEIVISYPYVTAIAVHRVAHELYIREIPLVPRIMSESAHAKTGIDIHPGAKIGNNFFIDHGTGVVIGETAIIGDNVKIYQGVTLGAMSFPKDERGRIIKGGKRHPTIEDGVTIYAEATILGDVTIGARSVIGGNVWLKKSVPAGTTVVTTETDSSYKHHTRKK